MPQFAPGESKTAIAPITVKPAGLSCEVEIFLGPDELTKVAASGRIPFTSTGASQNVHLPIAMPSEGTHHVYIDVYSNGILIGAYQAIEDVVIAAPIAFAYVSEITQGSCKIGIYSARSCEVDVQNTGSVAAECQLKVYANEYYNYTWTGWYDTGKVVQAIIQPGEVVKFAACMFAARSYTFSYKARFVGEPSTIESAKFTIRRYA